MLQKHSVDNENNSTEYVGLLGSIIDVIGNLSFVTIIIVALFSIILTILWNTIDYCETQKIELCGDILAICSCVLGFSITGFSVILALNKETLERLTIKPKIPNQWWKCFVKKKSSPYDILCASFSFTCFFLLLTIIVVVLYKNMLAPLYTNNCYFAIIQVLSIFSTLLVFDLVFHLYSVSTYLNKNHNRVRICNNKNT